MTHNFPKQRYREDSQYAIGTDPTNMARLRYMKIPPPDQVVWNPASSYYFRADGTRVGDGFATAQWIWDVISYENIQPIMEYLNGGDWVRLYVQTDVRDGTYPNPRTSFGIYYGIMLKPILTGDEGVPIARSPYALQTLALRFRRLVLQPGYL